MYDISKTEWNELAEQFWGKNYAEKFGTAEENKLLGSWWYYLDTRINTDREKITERVPVRRLPYKDSTESLWYHGELEKSHRIKPPEPKIPYGLGLSEREYIIRRIAHAVPYCLCGPAVRPFMNTVEPSAHPRIEEMLVKEVAAAAEEFWSDRFKKSKAPRNESDLNKRLKQLDRRTGLPGSEFKQHEDHRLAHYLLSMCEKFDVTPEEILERNYRTHIPASGDLLMS